MEKAAVTLEALKMAIARRQPGPGVIHHSDQGVQYASGEYVDELKRHGFLISMARAGNPYENAMTESLFKTLKHGDVNLCEYESYQDVVIGLPHFLEEVYNQKRLHSALGYRPPNEFEEVVLNQENNEIPRQTLINPICPIIGVQSNSCGRPDNPVPGDRWTRIRSESAGFLKDQQMIWQRGDFNDIKIPGDT